MRVQREVEQLKAQLAEMTGGFVCVRMYIEFVFPPVCVYACRLMRMLATH